MAESEKPGESQPGGWSFDEQLRVYLQDESLWPVLIVGFAIAVTLGAAVLIAALAVGNPFALAASALLVLVSLDVLQRDLRAWRLGLASRSVLVLWAASGAAAVAIVAFGWV